MRHVIKILAVVVFGFCCFVAGAITATSRQWGTPLVVVEIENVSGEEILSLRLKHENGMLEAKNTEPGTSKRLSFAVAGEGSYTLIAQFANGRVLEGGAGYVESGYRIKEVVRANEIKPDFSSLAYRP